MSDILKDVRSHCGSSQIVNVNLLVIPHIFRGYSVGYQSGQFISSCIYRNSVSWFNLSPYRSCHCHAIYTLKKDGCFLTTEWLATLVAWHIRG